MRGLMQEWPLLVHTFIDHAKIHHGEREIVTRKVEGDIHSTTYSEIHSRSKKFAKALKELGVAKRKLQDMLQQNDADFIVDAIMSIEDENVLDVLVDAIEDPKNYRI